MIYFDYLQALSDPIAIWFGRNTATPCRIAVMMDNDVELEAAVTGPSQCQLDLKIKGESFRNKKLTENQQSVVREIFIDNAIYVPPLGATSSIEHWTAYDNYQQQLQQGRYVETWRNKLNWLYNDGNKNRYKDVVELVQRYIPESEILAPRLSHDNPPSVIIEFIEDSQKYDIGLSGAGLRSLLNLAAVLLLSESRLILLDEPDSHLHGTLQRAVARMLFDFSTENGVQIITATHAPDFIGETPIDSIVWVDRTEAEARTVSSLARALVPFLVSEFRAVTPRENEVYG